MLTMSKYTHTQPGDELKKKIIIYGELRVLEGLQPL
jgi:hypothetical protein